MNWVTTNIRLPEEDYMELKLEALKQRKSLAALLREKVIKKPKTKKNLDNKARKILKELDDLAKENSKYVPKGKSMSELLIEMRYEQ